MKHFNDPAFTGTYRHGEIEGFWFNGQFYLAFAGGEEDPNSGNGDGDGNGDSNNTGATGGDDPDEKPRFSQKDVNALVAREVAKKTRGKLDPKELGFKDAKEMKDFFDKAKEKSDEEKTEHQKAIDEAKKETAKLTKDEVLPKAQRLFLKAEFKVSAQKAGVEHLEDAFTIVQSNPDLKDQIEVDYDNESVKGLDDEFFKQLKKSKPFLFKAEGDGDENDDEGDPPPGDAGAGATGGRKSAPNEAELQKKYPALGRN